MKSTQGRFFWKLFLGHALLLVAVVGVCVWFILDAFDRFYSEELTAHLTTHAEILRHEVRNIFDREHGAELDRLAESVVHGGPPGLRVTFVMRDGTVLGDSDANPSDMESHADRAEIREALAEGIGESVRWSATLDREMKYVAVRIGPPDAPTGVVRVSMGLMSMTARTQSTHLLIQKISLTAVAAAVVLALGLARLWSERIGQVTAAAESISQGNLTARAEVRGSDEVALLGRSLNQMRDNLARQLDTIDRQRRTLEYLLTQLHEGVVVAGPNGRIVLLNPAAARLLSSSAPAAVRLSGLDGPLIEECIPQEEVRLLLSPDKERQPGKTTDLGGAPSGAAAKVQEQRIHLERGKQVVSVLARASDILLPGVRGGEYASALELDPEPPAEGRLLVLTDITELARTMQVKADFAANASHELRTPLSAIRVAVETLLTMDMKEEAESAAQVLRVIDRHSHRLELIMADLLKLSRLESSATEFKVASLDMGDFLAESRDRFYDRIHEKNIVFEIEVDEACRMIEVSRDLLGLVIDNLIDNAIKFTDAGKSIRVFTEDDGEWIKIAVEDTGCGIPADEQDRVFERFYQVERARTGVTRGTGLGLSIVRHSVNAMGGTISLFSELGVGTRIGIRIPQQGGGMNRSGEGHAKDVPLVQ